MKLEEGLWAQRAVQPVFRQILSDADFVTAIERLATTPMDVREATGLIVNACGGVATGQDVQTCLEAGATTVQIYTALMYEGPGLVGQLCSGLRAAMVPSGA